MVAVINPRYLNRIELRLGGLAGPLTSAALGAFDPRRDLEVYADGELVTITSFSFDGFQNRYLMFADRPVVTASVVQVIHHMPSSPFAASGTTFGGFGQTFGFSFGG